MNRQTIFAIVLILALGITGYLWYGYFEVVPADEAATQNQALPFSRAGNFQNIRLDTSIFQDPLFISLQPPQIIPQPDVTPGRINPFAPF